MTVKIPSPERTQDLQQSSWKVTITYPQHPYSIKLSESRRAKYYEKAEDLPKTIYKKWVEEGSNKQEIKFGKLKKLYPVNALGERYIKNSKSVGTPKMWTVNGQDLYNAALYPQVRSKLTEIAHEYLKKYCIKSLVKGNIYGFGTGPLAFMGLNEITNTVYFTYPIKISCTIYEVRRPTLPDSSNMWIWLKWFEDALQEAGVIPNDNPNFVTSSGPTSYRFVKSEIERKLVFTIETDVCEEGESNMKTNEEKEEVKCTTCSDTGFIQMSGETHPCPDCNKQEKEQSNQVNNLLKEQEDDKNKH